MVQWVMTKDYRLGLDIGVGSVGWAVLANDVDEQPCRIVALGVRTFETNEVQKTGESTAKARREARGLRRRTRRRQLRKARLVKLLTKTLAIDYAHLYDAKTPEDVYALRARGLDERLSNEQLAKVILHLCKRRGFQSNRQGAKAGNDGALLKALQANTDFLAAHGYRTVGEALYRDERYRQSNCGREIYSIRNHGGDYRNCFQRQELLQELHLLLTQQQKLGNAALTADFITQVSTLFSEQRTFDEGPGAPSPYHCDQFPVGKCTFIPTEQRAPKASYTFELFRAWDKITKLRVNDQPLTLAQQQQIADYALEKEKVTFTQIRNLLALTDDQQFNLCRYERVKKGKKGETPTTLAIPEMLTTAEKTAFIEMKNSYTIRQALGYNASGSHAAMLDAVALCLSLCKSDARITAYIADDPLLSTLTTVQINALKGLNFDRFGHLSIKAMQRIIPYLTSGKRYDEACQLAGFGTEVVNGKTKYLSGAPVDDVLGDITSPVVKRAVNQTVRVINALVKRYGSPQYVAIELGRELARNFQERNRLAKQQAENAVKNQTVVELLQKEHGVLQPRGVDILKFKLYEEQGGKCLYSGQPLALHRVLHEPNYTQIDHILPFSRSMDDSYQNKALVLASENQNKGNRTPYEYFGADAARWAAFTVRVNLLNNQKKQSYLLKTNFGDEQSKEFITRNLTDTQYLSRVMLNLCQQHLQLVPSKWYKAKAQVRSVNGRATDYLRKCWGLTKIREDGDMHHAVDAAVIATITAQSVNRIANFNQLQEKFYRKGDLFVNALTRQVMTADEKAAYEQQQVDILAERLPLPYPTFREELKIRSTVKYDRDDFTPDEKTALRELGYTEDELATARPVFISRRKNVKTTGAIHQETLMSTREYAKRPYLIKTVNITDKSIKLSDQPESNLLKDDPCPSCSIVNYYNPESDRRLYLALKKHLLLNNNKITENVVFHKPRRDGTDGPVVKTVKIYVKNNKAVILPNGAAANAGMYRVDVFTKQGKYYLCPVYYADVYAHRLPNQVIEIGKDWTTIDDSFTFKFSLYQNDLIRVKSKNEIILNKEQQNEKSKKPQTITGKDFLLYYNNTNINGAKFGVKTHDRCYGQKSLGVKTLLSIEKCYVDLLGKVYAAPPEKRREI